MLNLKTIIKILYSTLDAGNTFIKLAFFDEKDCLETFYHLSEKEVKKLLEQKNPIYLMISSVRDFSEDFHNFLYYHFGEIGKNLFFLNPALSLPISNQYDTPHTLGMDRLATATGAWHLFPKKSCLIIDAGTCITYDFLDNEGNFQGGNITLGLEMRLKALHEYTAKLPKIEKDQTLLTLTGKSTAQAIHNGVVQGIIFEIKGYKNAYLTEKQLTENEFCTILCGGDTDFLLSKINFQIFARPNLALWGLYIILKFNVAKIS